MNMRYYSTFHLDTIFSKGRRVWRYQRGNQNPYIEEEQITQWPKEKVQKDKQRSTKHTYKTKDRVTRTPQKNGGELGCPGRVGISGSCSTSGTRRVNLVTTFLHWCSSLHNHSKIFNKSSCYTSGTRRVNLVTTFLYCCSSFHNHSKIFNKMSITQTSKWLWW
jgi:hypothetical protein